MKQPYATRKDNIDSAGGYHVYYEDNRNYSKAVLFIGTILMVLVIALVMGIIKVKASSLFLESVSNAPLYVCMLDNRQSPNQDSTYPPEGYHCRPLYTGQVNQAEQPSRKDRDNSQAAENVSPVIDTPSQEVTPSNDTTPPVVNEDNPKEDTPKEDTPSDDNPSQDDNDSDEGKNKKDKHPNNGKGNGQEGNPDCDPNDNPHANDND